MRARSLRQSVEELTNRYIATARYRAEEPVIEPATGMVEETAERPRSFEVPARIRKALVRAPRREGGSENPAATTQQKARGGPRCVAGDEGYGRGPNPIEERLLKRPLIPNPAAHQNRRQRHRPGSGHVSAIASSPQADQWPYHDWSIRSEGWDRRCRRHGMILTSRVAWTTFQPALEGRTRKIADDVARFALRLLDTPPAAGRLAASSTNATRVPSRAFTGGSHEAHGAIPYPHIHLHRRSLAGLRHAAALRPALYARPRQERCPWQRRVSPRQVLRAGSTPGEHSPRSPLRGYSSPQPPRQLGYCLGRSRHRAVLPRRPG